MKLKPEQLATHLKKTLLPVYLITGDEPLQVLEAADAVRAQAREAGYADRQVMNVDKSFDWNSLLEACGSLSLFSERRILELRMNGKPGDAGGKALLAYAQRPPEDTVLLVTCAKLDSAGTRAKWFQAMEAAGAVVQVWPIEVRFLPDWIEARMRRRGLQASRDAVQMLVERVEGNLLAASQEIEKLLLLHGTGRIGVDEVAESVADSARFNVFGLVDAALAGQAERVARMLSGLQGEGIAPVLVCWALGREVRAMAAMAYELSAGAGVEAVLARHRVWERRKPLLKTALKRHSLGQWHRLVARCGQAERVSKGAAVGNAWDELLQLGLELAGSRLFAASGRRA